MDKFQLWTKEDGLKVLELKIEQQEKLTQKQLLAFFDKKWLIKNDLAIPLIKYWNGSPFEMLNDLYPNQFKEWQLKDLSKGYWIGKSSSEALEALRWIIEEKEQLTEEQILQVYNKGWLIKHRLKIPLLEHWNANTYEMLNELYPNRFKVWQWDSLKNEYWRKSTSLTVLEELKWLIEEKNHLTKESVLKVVDLNWLKKNKFIIPLRLYWEGNPQKMLNDLYPDTFRKDQFSKFWTIEKALTTLQWILEEKEQLTEEQIYQEFSTNWLIKNKLNTPLKNFWGSNPYKMINDLYPNRFKEWLFKNVPKDYWTEKTALKALKWTIEEKEQLIEEQVPQRTDIKWFERNKLAVPLRRFWSSSPYKMINDLYPNRFKAWQFPKVPRGFWTKEKVLEALKWTIEEKEQLTDKELMMIFSANWLRKHRLVQHLVTYWDYSPFKMLDDLYPGHFKEWDFKRAPKNFWTKEKALEAFSWTIKEKEQLTEEQLLQKINRDWVKQHKLLTPYQRYWNGNPHKMLSDLYQY
ncbi:hypothetical protein [Bacillus gaemokensis]|uniref:hypothetical protein n=1 Tax=Bacillus gaemokensis TaxID=574375 RepID=UPI000689D1B6|nr:hypothetical protein [Bacillus gaemokensis]KYG33861.1 hypothetical protein AZF08_27045 [Bacillus gaemokensis]